MREGASGEWTNINTNTGPNYTTRHPPQFVPLQGSRLQTFNRYTNRADLDDHHLAMGRQLCSVSEFGGLLVSPWLTVCMFHLAGFYDWRAIHGFYVTCSIESTTHDDNPQRSYTSDCWSSQACSVQTDCCWSCSCSCTLAFQGGLHRATSKIPFWRWCHQVDSTDQIIFRKRFARSPRRTSCEVTCKPTLRPKTHWETRRHYPCLCMLQSW